MEEALVTSSQAKLDELFLLWLSLPEAQSYVQDLLANVRKGRPIITIQSVGPGGDGSSPNKSGAGKAAVLSPPPRSPTGRPSRSGMLGDGFGTGGLSPTDPSSDQAVKGWHLEASDDASAHQQAQRRKNAAMADRIPRFYFPKSARPAGKLAPAAPAGPVTPSAKAEREEMDRMWAGLPPTRLLTKEELLPFTTKVCELPSFLNSSLHCKLSGVSSAAGATPAAAAAAAAAAPGVERAAVEAFWNDCIRDASPAERLFNVLREKDQSHVTRQDWRFHLAAMLDTHPGLDFLKATPEFQERYLECVVERIYYTNNRADTGRMTLHDIERSNLVKVLHVVEAEGDINKINDYFSYEHFYVLYCKFWELDTNHDFLLDRDDVVKLSNYALTYRIVDRIFEGACRRLASGVADRLGYQDFIWLLLSEEDKTSDTALRYWFNAIDLDGDGTIRPFEMEFFYKEQLHRMDCLGQEVVQFPDILCQMTDMVKPARPGAIALADLRRCRQAGVFFNVLFNLTKFIQYDQRDPQLIFHERSTPELTDWDRFAKAEYARLSMEEEDADAAAANTSWDGGAAAGIMDGGAAGA